MECTGTGAHLLAAGEIAALGTACCWSISPLLFEAAGRRVGVMPVNVLRVCLAILLMVGTGLICGRAFPRPSAEQLLYLGASGVIGFAIGDACLLAAYVRVGARLTLLVNTTVPLLAMLGGRMFLSERLGPRTWLGMAATIVGVAWVISARQESVQHAPKTYTQGILLALGSSAGQAVGLILSKQGLQGYEAWAGTEIRLAAGLLGILVTVTLRRCWTAVRSALREPQALAQLGVGAIFGPFLGVFLSLVAVEHTATGIAATLMALPPVLILIPTMLVLRQPVTVRAGLGAVGAVAGVLVMLI